MKLPTHVRTKSAPSAMHVERSDSAQEFIQTLYLAEDFLTDDNSGSPKIQALRIRDDKPVLSAFTDDGRVTHHSLSQLLCMLHLHDVLGLLKQS